MRTETGRGVVFLLKPPPVASMEPSSVEDGNVPEKMALIDDVKASMEPSSVEDGNYGALEDALDELLASMEPSSVEDGNAQGELADRLESGGFNGAVLS